MTPEQAMAAGKALVVFVTSEGQPPMKVPIVGMVRLERFDVFFQPGWFLPAHAGHPIHAAPGHFELVDTGNTGLMWRSGHMYIDEILPEEDEDEHAALLALRAEAEKAGAVARMEEVARDSYRDKGTSR